MKKFLWFITIVIIVSACSKDDDEKFISEDSIEVYQNAFENAVNFVVRDASVSMSTAMDYFKNLDGVTAVIEDDSIVRVTTQGNVQFSIDFNNYPDYEIGDVDFGALQHYEDSINNAIGGIASGYEQTSDVFSDYITSITQQDENTTTTTRAASSTVIRLARRNFVIWSPYTRSDFVKEKEDVIKVVKRQTNRCGWTTIFSPTSFTELGYFDVVFFSCHGGKDGSFFLPDDCLSEKAVKDYEQEMSKERSGVERASRKIGNTRVKGYCLRENFFNNHLPNLSHTVIYTSACYFGADNCVFRKCCEAKDVADYFGSDNACIGADVLSAFAEFYPKLMNGASTKMAFKNGRSYFTGALLRGKKLETFKFKRFGKKTVSYAIPHASGVGSRSKTRTRADGNDGSQTIVNAQLRYSSEETDDILKSIEAGICLQDMETKEVTLIPFSDKNIVSNEKKAYGDVNVNNIAASLNNLIEGHQYAYCCYTNVDGVITLSDESYKFSKTDNYKLWIKLNYTLHHTWYDGNGKKLGDNSDDSFGIITIEKKNDELYYSAFGILEIGYVEEIPDLKDFLIRNTTTNDEYGSINCNFDENSITINRIVNWKNYRYSLGNYLTEGNVTVKISNIDTTPVAEVSKFCKVNEYESGMWEHGHWEGIIDYYEYNYTFESSERNPL